MAGGVTLATDCLCLNSIQCDSDHLTKVVVVLPLLEMTQTTSQKWLCLSSHGVLLLPRLGFDLCQVHLEDATDLQLYFVLQILVDALCCALVCLLLVFL